VTCPDGNSLKASLTVQHACHLYDRTLTLPFSYRILGCDLKKAQDIGTVMWDRSLMVWAIECGLR
jgi:hypothetical protein